MVHGPSTLDLARLRHEERHRRDRDQHCAEIETGPALRERIGLGFVRFGLWILPQAREPGLRPQS